MNAASAEIATTGIVGTILGALIVILLRRLFAVATDLRALAERIARIEGKIDAANGKH